MGNIELYVKKQRTRRNIQQAVLSAIAVTGILALAMVAPNVIGAMGRIIGDKYKFGYRARTVAGRLAKKGLVEFLEKDGKKYLRITEKGRHALALETEKAALRDQRKRRWDGQYRLVMFDVPEKRKSVRNRLRAIMHGCGFLRIQDSVWVYPYDCEEFVTLLKAELRIGKDVLYVVVECIENDRWIKKHFRLV